VQNLDDVLDQAAAWRAAGREVALATVIETWGSSPRPAGSQLVVDEHGAFAGSVSGGCIEGAVVQAALEVLGGAPPRALEFGVTNDRAWEVGLACGGRVRLLVERADPELLEAVRRARAEGRPVVVETRLPGGEHRVHVGDIADAAARRAVARDESFVDGDRFLRVWNPPLRMVIIGAVHVAQALAQLAPPAGFAVTVIDPRRAFATPERFPGVELSTLWPDKAMTAVAPDARTAVVALTHDPKLDDPALRVALASPAFYVGALGSKRTQAQRAARLAEAGLAPEQLARIHGPVGLDIGARTSAEIAVAILAEVVSVLRR
jgi:xanthine dehydrogenase accessory factor